MSDEELVAGIQRADQACFTELYERYFKRVYGFVQGRMRNHADAEEVTQETFVAVFKAIDNFSGQSALLSWIFGIAKNLSNNTIRRFQTQRERIDSVDKEYFIPDSALGSGSPDEELMLSRYGEIVREEMEDVPAWQREVFEMRHLKGLSIPEISSRSNRSNDAVRSSLYRTKKIMMEAIGHEEGGALK